MAKNLDIGQLIFLLESINKEIEAFQWFGTLQSSAIIVAENQPGKIARVESSLVMSKRLGND